MSQAKSEKQGRFVTIDEQPIFIGGPSQGAGGSGGGGAVPAGKAPTSKREDLMSAAKKSRLLSEGLQADHYYNAGHYDRGEVKHEIAYDIASRTDLTYDEAKERVDAWSKTSADHNEQSLALQLATAGLLGQEVNEYLKGKLDLERKAGRDIRASEKDIQFVRAMYQSTQERLYEHGFKPGDTVRLQRGVMVPERDRYFWQEGASRPISTNPLSSWTAQTSSTGSEIATRFARFPKSHQNGVVLEMEVPIASIVSTARTGIGCLTEGEFVVLGGFHEAKVVKRYTYMMSAGGY